jgi:hypothetical protein
MHKTQSNYQNIYQNIFLTKNIYRNNIEKNVTTFFFFSPRIFSIVSFHIIYIQQGEHHLLCNILSANHIEIYTCPNIERNS